MKRLLLLVLLLLGFTAQAQNSFYYQPGPAGPMKILLLDNADGTYSIGMSASGGSGTPTYYYVQGPLGPMKVKLIDQGEGAYRIATAQTAGLTYKGAIDCSANPNYPAANSGDLYKVSVSGKIGGASGTTVSAGDTFFCTTDSTAAGNEATVGSYWVHMVATSTGGGGSGTVTNTSGNLTASALMVGNGGADSKVLASLGTTTTVLHGNAAGLPTWGAVAIGSDVSGLGTGVATFLGTPTSANLAAALTDETGTGAAVFATSPSLTTPSLGVATATSINKVAITAPATGSTLTIADGATLTASATASVSGTNNGGANPTASIGLTAVNGTANTFLRSDGAPALDQTIAPTWTSVHTFQQAVAATSTDGVVLSTSATATSGNQKYSPALHFKGSGWGTTGGAANSVDWRLEVRPVQTTVSYGELVFSHSKNGGAYNNALIADEGNWQWATTIALGDSSGSRWKIFGDGGMVVTTAGGYGFYSGAASNANLPDVFMYRDAAATWRFGQAAANPPVAQTLSVQDASGTDIAGATWTFRGSRGTGAAAVTGKSFSWQTPDAGSTGTTLQTATEKLALTGDGNLIQSTVNGAQWIRGQASELLTLSTSGTTTDTSANLLPANSIIEAVVARVTTTITTATDWKLGDATTAGRFSAANSTMTAGTTQVGLVHVDQTGAAGPKQTSAAKVRVTTTGTPGAGAIRITVFYRQFVAPVSALIPVQKPFEMPSATRWSDLGRAA